MNPARKALRALAAGLALAGLTAPLSGCGGEPATTPFSFLPPTALFNPSRSPTSSPTPTGPVRMTDDPTWTPEQLAAVQTVDKYYEVMTQLVIDPAHANFGQLIQVADEPQYTKDVDNTLRRVSLKRLYVGDNPFVIPVTRNVSPVTTVEGRPEIHVTDCQVDNPAGQWIQDNAPLDVGPPRAVYDHAVQWIDTLQGWRVVDRTKVREGC